ncbi:hypothetical protein FIU94_05930 [Sulfitobacter sp. THAF37]|uniref:DUF1217 domain-containing protein n=1 Tax=Sulfitobacter sp. THAF37 TaxID=2587855 RepID=UPI001267E45F|nr:DUF1217 domain-containing protein [Sulfitobacter sp. THAF37]QFT58360.1 hypothetical protein FIU94_05930 [Sulfitobacter sp. THAF37]
MFQPVVPISGLAGWRFLQRTYDTQFDTFSKGATLQRDAEYFRENIGQVRTAEDLTSDRRLMTVALSAFGLQDDVDNRYFIRKVLEEGVTNEDALANRFSDPRYRELSEAFGFGPGEYLKTGEVDFAEAIITRHLTNSFEVAAGEQDASMRVALYAQRELAELAGGDMSNDAKWFTVMGDPPMRQLFETAFNLPAALGQIDIDQQLQVFKDAAKSVLGSDDLSLFTAPEARDDLITKFVVRDQIRSFSAGMSGTSIALTLLQG